MHCDRRCCVGSPIERHIFRRSWCSRYGRVRVDLNRRDQGQKKIYGGPCYHSDDRRINLLMHWERGQRRRRRRKRYYAAERARGGCSDCGVRNPDQPRMDCVYGQRGRCQVYDLPGWYIPDISLHRNVNIRNWVESLHELLPHGQRS